MTRSVLVLGPESSGTKLTAQILVSNGCAGTFTDAQGWFPRGWPPATGCFVTRCSLPHGMVWYEPLELIRRFEVDAVIVTVRERQAMIRSQIARGHVHSAGEARAHIRRALRAIATVLESYENVYVLPYEALVLLPQAQESLLNWLGLPLRATVPVYDGDSKHYKEVASG